MIDKISILGCGWLGLPLGKAIANAGYQVKGATTTSEKLSALKEANIRPYLLHFDPDAKHVGDFFDTDLLILNLPPRNRNNNDSYHQQQLEAIKTHATNAGVPKVLFVSSTAVYPDTNAKVDEADASPEALSRGGIPLLLMEQLFTGSDAFQTTVIRFGGLYGPDRHPGRFLAGKQNIPGADNPVNMIHQADCIGVIQAIIAQNLWGKTYNACAPGHPTRKAFYLDAAEKLGLQPPQFNDKPKDFKQVSADKLLKDTGYTFLHDLQHT